MQVIYGSTQKKVIVDQLVEAIDAMDDSNNNNTLYVGYPILASVDETISVDAMYISDDHGLVVFSLPDAEGSLNWRSIKDQQDSLYFSLQGMLSKYPDLRIGRNLAVAINVISFLPDIPDIPLQYADLVVASPQTLTSVLTRIPPVELRLRRSLDAALQRVATIKPVKKRQAVVAGTKGAKMKQIERNIANLDQWQKHAAIETPDGPQRIRGLAGSGKTVVLALKAAYLHTQHPEWTIALTFHSRSLYQQLTDLIERFTFEHQADKPDWEKLLVRHSWGSSNKYGMYSEIADRVGAPIHTFMYAKSKYGMNRAFEGICNELLVFCTNLKTITPCYDAVLIDEAQDLPVSFFRLVYMFCKEPKRVVWAYDELQNLSDSVMPGVAELFGKNESGSDLVEINNIAGQPKQDIILPVCYRNTPWALTLAHALGIGTGREPLVQHFDDVSLWEEVGYRVVSGTLEYGQRVELERRAGSYPDYFNQILTPAEAIETHCFNNEDEQAGWIASAVEKNLNDDGLEPDDILIIIPDTIRAKSKASIIIQALSLKKIESHLAGVSSSTDEIFSRSSVSIANVYRAKGNEAPMVYIADSHFCYSGYELAKLRNMLFTSITRSKCWVRICGHGPEMKLLETEIQIVVNNEFKLIFRVPTEGELKNLRCIHRDRTAEEKKVIDRAEKGLKEFLNALANGAMAIENLPLNLKTELTKLISGKKSDETEEID